MSRLLYGCYIVDCTAQNSDHLQQHHGNLQFKDDVWEKIEQIFTKRFLQYVVLHMEAQAKTFIDVNVHHYPLKTVDLAKTIFLVKTGKIQKLASKVICPWMSSNCCF